MRVYLGSDHAGFELKNHLVNHLAKQGHDVVDVGPHVYDPEDDYPAFCLHTGARVVADPGSLGIVIGGSGNGEQIAANKVAGVRSALVWRVEIAQLARQHNDANVIAIGARQHTLDEAAAFVEAFLATPFSGNPRHARRIDQLAELRTHPRAARPALPVPPLHRPGRPLAVRPTRPAPRRRGRSSSCGQQRLSGWQLLAGHPVAAHDHQVRSASARSSSVGRAASRARSAAPTLTCDDPEPTRPRRPRSASRSSPPPPVAGGSVPAAAAARRAPAGPGADAGGAGTGTAGPPAVVGIGTAGRWARRDRHRRTARRGGDSAPPDRPAWWDRAAAPARGDGTVGARRGGIGTAGAGGAVGDRAPAAPASAGGAGGGVGSRHRGRRDGSSRTPRRDARGGVGVRARP